MEFLCSSRKKNTEKALLGEKLFSAFFMTKWLFKYFFVVVAEAQLIIKKEITARCQEQVMPEHLAILFILLLL
jgi:hypothetical protein